MRPSSYQVQVTVMLRADMDEPHTEAEIRNAAVQAIENALRLGEDNGFSHEFADHVSFGLVAVESGNVAVRRGAAGNPRSEHPA